VTDEALSNMIVLEAKETFVKDLEAFLTTFVARCRGEEGCLKYDCFQSFEKPSRFMLVMEWSEERSLQRHFESEHVREFFDRVGKEWLLASPEQDYRNFSHREGEFSDDEIPLA